MYELKHVLACVGSLGGGSSHSNSVYSLPATLDIQQKRLQGSQSFHNTIDIYLYYRSNSNNYSNPRLPPSIIEIKTRKYKHILAKLTELSIINTSMAMGITIHN
jgi:hypothetical protein